MWCFRRRRQPSGGGSGGRNEKHRDLEGMPQTRDLSTMPPRQDHAAVTRDRRIPSERRETVRATTEFKWPPRISEVTLSSPRLENYQHVRTRPTTGASVVPEISEPQPEKESAWGSPTSFHFAPEAVYLGGDEYHISPRVSQDMHSHKFKYGPDASLPDLAELPPNEVVPPQIHELPGPTPPLILPQEMEGSLALPRPPPRLQMSPSPTPTSRFSSRR